MLEAWDFVVPTFSLELHQSFEEQAHLRTPDQGRQLAAEVDRSERMIRMIAQANGRRDICPLCGQLSFLGQVLCEHHSRGEDSWGRGNKAACDALHRGVWRTEPDPEPFDAWLARVDGMPQGEV